MIHGTGKEFRSELQYQTSCNRSSSLVGKLTVGISPSDAGSVQLDRRSLYTKPLWQLTHTLQNNLHKILKLKTKFSNELCAELSQNNGRKGGE